MNTYYKAKITIKTTQGDKYAQYKLVRLPSMVHFELGDTIKACLALLRCPDSVIKEIKVTFKKVGE